MSKSSPVVLRAEERAEQAGPAVLAAEVTSTDDVLVQWQDGAVGTLAASALLAALSTIDCSRELPVDTLKIDKSFIDKLGRSDEDTEIVGGVMRLAHSIGLTVTAEGIERPDQDIAWRRMGCD